MEHDSELFNLYAYHTVFADSIKVIYQYITQKDEEVAKKIAIMNYIYANVITGKKAIPVEQLQEMDIYTVFAIMAKEQVDANLAPTQNMQRSLFFNRIASKVAKKEGNNSDGGE